MDMKQLCLGAEGKLTPLIACMIPMMSPTTMQAGRGRQDSFGLLLLCQDLCALLQDTNSQEHLSASP